MDQDAPTKFELNSENLAAAVKMFIELAAESTSINDAPEDDVDAAIYKDLLDLEGTPKVLAKIVTSLLVQRERRALRVRKLRTVHFIHRILATYPPTLQLPAGARARVIDEAAACGIELAESEVVGVLDALARQDDSPDGRPARIYAPIVGESISDNTLRGMLDLLDPERTSKKGATTPAGRIKFAEQLDVAFYEGAGGTASLGYVLEVIGKGTPEAAARALAGWCEGLQSQLDRGLRESGLL